MTRKRAVAVLLAPVLFASFFLTSCSQAGGNAGIIVLQHCTLIDGTGHAPIPDAVVLIENGRIAAAGTESGVPVPAGSRVIDLKGATVLPGFINAHVHQAYNEQNLQSWLKAGVTTVRDEAPMSAKDFLAQRDRFKNNRMNAAIVSATPILTVPGGYGTPGFTTAEEAKKAVEEYIGRGVDIIKFSIEDDLQYRTWQLPTFEEVKAIVDAAHIGKRKVSVHISHERNLQWAIDAGVDDIAHMVVEPLDEETAALLAEKGICWVPTLELWKGVSEMHSLNWIDIAIENLSVFRQAGGRVALGTDFAGYTCTFDRGFPITEAVLMQQAGMSPMEIIVAGTKNAAFVCGLEGITGTVEAGRAADLLIITGDPLTDLNALLNVRMVVHGGQIVVDNSPR